MNSFFSSRSIYVNSLDFLHRWSSHLQIGILIGVNFIFLALMHWLELPATVFNKGSESRLPCLVHLLNGKTFLHLPLTMLAIEASLVVHTVKNLPAMQETWVQPLNQEDPLERAWPPIIVLLPEEFHGQRILAGYSPWSLKELNMTEQLTHTYRHTHNVICKFFLDVLYQLGEVSFYIYFPESFFKINECWILTNATSALIGVIMTLSSTFYMIYWAFLVLQLVKNWPAMWET